jgi:AbiV family abortive infection protein
LTRSVATELSELKQEAFKNAVHLFCDACLLYRAGSYPSSYGLAVLSFEELGKVLSLDRLAEMLGQLPDKDRSLAEYADRLHSHEHKQGWADRDGLQMSRRHSKTKTNFISNRGLSDGKEQAFYVESRKGQVLTPSRITRSKAATLIHDVLASLEASGDIGFNGFWCMSTPQSEYLAGKQLAAARLALEECNLAP